MSDRDALYRAILADPADDTPRLAYADWLEENGRPEEAEFIRIGCRLETIAPDDPDFVDLLDRKEELMLWLGAHSPGPKLKLSGGLTVGAGEGWWNWTRRGFPRFLEFDGHGRNGLAPIRALAAALSVAFARIPTRWLVIRFITVDQLAELLKHPVIAALDALTIQLGVTDEAQDEVYRSLAQLAAFPRLRRLCLAVTLGNAGADLLSRAGFFEGIEHLALEPAGLTRAAIRSLAGSEWFRNLRELDLSANCSAEGFEELCEQKPFPILRSLELADNDFPPAVWQTFARSKAFPALADLSLARTDLSGARFAAFADAKWFRPSGLDLGACAIGNDGARQLVQTLWTETLTRLDLRHNNLGTVGTAAVAQCSGFARLRRLNLSYNTLGVRSFRAIAANPSLRGLTALELYCHQLQRTDLKPDHFQRFLRDLDMPNLRHFDLSGHHIGNRAARLLADEKFRSLTRLRLSHCKLTDAATAEFLAAPTLQNLIELDLSNNGLRRGVSPLTDHGLLPRLSNCDLRGNSIAAELVRKLKRRPGIHP